MQLTDYIGRNARDELSQFNTPKADFSDLTVLIPSYNQGHYIVQLLDQLKPLRGLKVIVVDGGSTDTTVRVLKANSTWVRYVSETDDGQADALRKGLEMVETRYACYQNSDDLFLVNELWRALDQIQRRSIDVAYAPIVRCDEFGEVFDVQDYSGHPRWARDYVIPFNNQSLIFDVEKLRALNISVDTGLHFCFDLDLALKICAAPSLVVARLDEPFGVLRYYHGTKTSNLQDMQEKELRQLRERHGYPRFTSTNLRFKAWRTLEMMSRRQFSYLWRSRLPGYREPAEVDGRAEGHLGGAKERT